MNTNYADVTDALPRIMLIFEEQGYDTAKVRQELFGTPAIPWNNQENILITSVWCQVRGRLACNPVSSSNSCALFG